MNVLNFQLFAVSLILTLIQFVYSGSRMYTQGTKYENEEYIKLFRIPRNYISSFMSPGTKNYPLGIAFNDRFDDYWMSPVEGTYVKDIEKGIVYNPLKVNITVTFTKKYSLKV